MTNYIRPVVRVYVYPTPFIAALKVLGYIVLFVMTMTLACALTTALKEVL